MFSAQKKGFSLIEIIVAISILTLVTLPLFFNYITATNSQGLKSSTGQVADLIKSAHVYAREAKDQKDWGVIALNPKTVVLVSGSKENYQIKQQVILEKHVTIVDLFSIWFELGIGESDKDYTVSLVNDRENTSLLTIYKTGVVDISYP